MVTPRLANAGNHSIPAALVARQFSDSRAQIGRRLEERYEAFPGKLVGGHGAHRAPVRGKVDTQYDNSSEDSRVEDCL